MLLFAMNEPLSRLQPVRTSCNQSVALPKSQIPRVNPIKPVICPAGWAGWEVGRQDWGTNKQPSSQEWQEFSSSPHLTTPVASLGVVGHWDSRMVLFSWAEEAEKGVLTIPAPPVCQRPPGCPLWSSSTRDRPPGAPCLQTPEQQLLLTELPGQRQRGAMSPAPQLTMALMH